MRFTLRQLAAKPGRWQLADDVSGEIWEADLSTLAVVDVGIPAADPVYAEVARAVILADLHHQNNPATNPPVSADALNFAAHHLGPS